MMLDAAARLARLLPPEAAHRAGVQALKLGAGALSGGAPKDPALQTELAGLKLPNPIGLAAGFDKDAEAVDGALALGFGFVEVGAVTPRPQPGNPRPRLFRLAKDRAVINRYGFNSVGLEVVARRLAARRKRKGVVGVNLGANKDTTDRAADFVLGLRRLAGLADFFTLNVSSPNTPGIRDLQRRDALEALLERVTEARVGSAGSQPAAPLFIKVAPDLAGEEITAIAEAAAAVGVSGLIVANTTLERPEGLKSRWRGETGGLSGRPLFKLSTNILVRFRRATGGRLPLIGVGGVEDGATAYAKIRAGASAVQLYTALVYEGPGVVRRIAKELGALLKRDGFASVADAVGADAHRSS
jgi:dihydroorotate dehydrogenase